MAMNGISGGDAVANGAVAPTLLQAVPPTPVVTPSQQPTVLAGVPASSPYDRPVSPGANGVKIDRNVAFWPNSSATQSKGSVLLALRVGSPVRGVGGETVTSPGASKVIKPLPGALTEPPGRGAGGSNSNNPSSNKGGVNDNNAGYSGGKLGSTGAARFDFVWDLAVKAIQGRPTTVYPLPGLDVNRYELTWMRDVYQGNDNLTERQMEKFLTLERKIDAFLQGKATADNPQTTPASSNKETPKEKQSVPPAELVYPGLSAAESTRAKALGTARAHAFLAPLQAQALKESVDKIDRMHQKILQLIKQFNATTSGGKAAVPRLAAIVDQVQALQISLGVHVAALTAKNGRMDSFLKSFKPLEALVTQYGFSGKDIGLPGQEGLNTWKSMGTLAHGIAAFVQRFNQHALPLVQGFIRDANAYVRGLDAAKANPDAKAPNGEQPGSVQPQQPATNAGQPKASAAKLTADQLQMRDVLEGTGILDSFGAWLQKNPQTAASTGEQQLGKTLVQYLEKNGFANYVKARHGSAPAQETVKQAAVDFLRERSALLNKQKGSPWDKDAFAELAYKSIPKSEREDWSGHLAQYLEENSGGKGPPKPPKWWNRNWSDPGWGKGDSNAWNPSNWAQGAWNFIAMNPWKSLIALISVAGSGVSLVFTQKQYDAASPSLDGRYIDPFKIFVTPDPKGEVVINGQKVKLHLASSAPATPALGSTGEDRVSYINKALNNVGGSFDKLDLTQARFNEFKKTHPNAIAVDWRDLPKEYFYDPKNIMRLKKSEMDHGLEQLLSEEIRTGNATQVNLDASAWITQFKNIHSLVSGKPPTASTNDLNHPSYWGRTQPMGVIATRVLETLKLELGAMGDYVAQLNTERMQAAVSTLSSEKTRLESSNPSLDAGLSASLKAAESDYKNIQDRQAALFTGSSDVAAIVKENREAIKTLWQDAENTERVMTQTIQKLGQQDLQAEKSLQDVTKFKQKLEAEISRTTDIGLPVPNSLNQLLVSANQLQLGLGQFRQTLQSNVAQFSRDRYALIQQIRDLKLKGAANDIAGSTNAITGLTAARSAWETRIANYNKAHYADKVVIDADLKLKLAQAGVKPEFQDLPFVNGAVIFHPSGAKNAKEAAQQCMQELQRNFPGTDYSIVNPPAILTNPPEGTPPPVTRYSGQNLKDLEFALLKYFEAKGFGSGDPMPSLRSADPGSAVVGSGLTPGGQGGPIEANPSKGSLMAGQPLAPPHPAPASASSSASPTKPLPVPMPPPLGGKPDSLPPPPENVTGANSASQTANRGADRQSASAIANSTTASGRVQLADRQAWEAGYGNLSRQSVFQSLAHPYEVNGPMQDLYRSLSAQFESGGRTTRERFEMLVQDSYRPLWLNPTTGPAMVAAWAQLNKEWVAKHQPEKPLPIFAPALAGRLQNQDSVFPPQEVDSTTGAPLSWRNSGNVQKWEMFHKVPPHSMTYSWSDVVYRSGDRTSINATYTDFCVRFDRLLGTTAPELRAKQQLLSGSESLWRDEEYGPVMHDMWSKLNNRLGALGQPAVEPPRFLLVPSPRHAVEVLPAVQKLQELNQPIGERLSGYNDPEPASYQGSGNPKPWPQLMAEGRKELVEMRLWPLALSYDNFIRHHLGSVDAATRAALLKQQEQLIEWIKSAPETLAAKRVTYFGLESALLAAQKN